MLACSESIADAAERTRGVHLRRRPESAREAGLIERQARVAAADLAVVEVLAPHHVVLTVPDIPDLRRQAVRSTFCAETLNVVMTPRM